MPNPALSPAVNIVVLGDREKDFGVRVTDSVRTLPEYPIRLTQNRIYSIPQALMLEGQRLVFFRSVCLCASDVSFGPGSFTVPRPVEQLSAWFKRPLRAVLQILPAQVQRLALGFSRTLAPLFRESIGITPYAALSEHPFVQSCLSKKPIGGLNGREANRDFRSWSWMVLGVCRIESNKAVLVHAKSSIADWSGNRDRSWILAQNCRRDSPHLGVSCKATTVASHSFGNGFFRTSSARARGTR